MSLAERIQTLLDIAIRSPERDAAGRIIPASIDAAVRARALNDCLRIVKDEEQKDGLS